MARTVRRPGVKKVPLSEIKDDLSRYLREAETQEIVITRHGKPAGVPIGFESEEDWFDYRLENDPRFLRRIERARKNLRQIIARLPSADGWCQTSTKPCCPKSGGPSRCVNTD
jgi:prevent-host-death family protein